MEGQSKGSRVLEVYCKGGQDPPGAVAPSKKRKNEEDENNNNNVDCAIFFVIPDVLVLQHFFVFCLSRLHVFSQRSVIMQFRVYFSVLSGECRRSRVHLKCYGRRLDTGGEVKGKMANVMGTLHTTSEHGVSSITTAEAHTSGCQ